MYEQLDHAAAWLAAACALLYHLRLHRHAQTAPQRAVHSANALARERWVTRMMSEPAREILAVQTLRNSVMAASFMASTAILLMMAVLSLAGDTARLMQVRHLWPWYAPSAGGGETKLLITALLLFGAFFLFAMSVRFFAHVGYLIAAPEGNTATAAEIAAAVGYLNRAGRFFSWGLRSFFFSIPPVFWIFGALPLLCATLGLIVALLLLDRVPG